MNELRGIERKSFLRESPFPILPGQYFDAETGLHQNWHRDYDPSIGRYLQSDPLGLYAGLSTYSYANSNPIRYTDPLGLISTLDLCKNPKNAEACEAAGVVPKPKMPSASSMKSLNSNAEVMARGRDIRKVDDLCEKFGGRPKDWKKKKGWDEQGQEWHWYERDGQKFGWKHAGEADPF